MGLLHRLCEEEKWERALERINDIAELVVALDNFGMWQSKVMDSDDFLFVLSVLEDDIREAKDHEFYMDLDNCEYDEDFEDEDDFDDDECDCETCNVENCPCEEYMMDDDISEEPGGWSC